MSTRADAGQKLRAVGKDREELKRTVDISRAHHRPEREDLRHRAHRHSGKLDAFWLPSIAPDPETVRTGRADWGVAKVDHEGVAGFRFQSNRFNKPSTIKRNAQGKKK